MKIVRLILRIVLILITIVVVYPFVWSIFSSFKTNEEFLASPFSLPSGFYLDNFVRAFQKSNIAGNFLSSIIVLICTLFLVVLFTVPASYVLSRYRFAGRRLIKSFFMALIFVPVSLIMIPLFSQMSSMHLLNNRIALSFVYAAMLYPFSIFLLSGYMESIPKSYEEAAEIDGCSPLRTLVYIITPLAKSGIFTVVLLDAMNAFNEYAIALVLITDQAKQTIPVGIATLYEAQRYATDWGALFAALTIVIIPTVVFYIAGQRYLIEGVNVGGIKE